MRKTLGCLVAAVLLAGCSGGGGSTATASRVPSTGSPAGPLSFSPTVPEGPADKTVSLYDVNGGQPVTMTLVDTMNLKRYAVVQDANGRDLQPQEVGLSTLPGGSATGTYTFAAPPSGVTAIDVYFANFPPFRDVPVSR